MSLLKMRKLNSFHACRKTLMVVITIAVFLSIIFVFADYNQRTYGDVYISTPDGDLYLSVAKNFIDNGRFIQTDRPNEKNFVVPPGVPAILTIVLGMGGDTYMVVALQYVLFAVSAVLLMRSCGNFCKGFQGNILVPILFVAYSIKTGNINPSMILTETYTVFFLSLALYLFSRRNDKESTKAIWIMACFLIMVFIRPAVAVLLVLPIVHLCIMAVKKNLDKETVKKVLCLFCAFFLCLAINIKSNYKETGYFVPLQNYGGIPLYQANNINTKSHSYSSGQLKEFSDEYFFQIYFDENLDSHQKSSILGTRAKQFVIENPLFCVKKAIERYANFAQEWNVMLALALLSLLYLVGVKTLSWQQCAYILGAFLFLTIPPCFGLYISRYYIYHLVISSVLLGSFIQTLIGVAVKYMRNTLKKRSRYLP